MGRNVASKKLPCLKFSFVCKATMWPVFVGLSKSARHTDLCMELGEVRGKGLFHSSGSSWQNGRRVAAHDPKELKNPVGTGTWKLSWQLSSLRHSIDISWGHRQSLSSNPGVASGIPQR